MPEVIEIEGQSYNVQESFALYDTVAVLSNLSTLSRQPAGWYPSFALMGAANDHHFFDIRNKSTTDRAYCNLDVRDQFAFAFLLKHISVNFFCPYITTQVQNTDNNFLEPFQSAFWSGELPQHCGLTLKINQDEHLKANCLELGAGPTPVGGGAGQGFVEQAPFATQPAMLGTLGQGVSTLDNAWEFPRPIGIPRKAAVSVVITPSEWARQNLQWRHGPYSYTFLDDEVTANFKSPVMFGIRVTLHGNRLVQPRGSYRA